MWYLLRVALSSLVDESSPLAHSPPPSWRYLTASVSGGSLTSVSCTAYVVYRLVCSMATTVSSAAPPTFHLSPAAKDILAGTCAGMMSIIVVHPLDTIRVRLQTTNAARFTGVADVVRQTLGKEGLLGFYKGMATPLVSQGVQKATMFFAFGSAKRQLGPYFLSSSSSSAALPPLQFIAVCGGIAGGANALVAAPIELVRNRLQVQYHSAVDKSQALYRGPIDCIRKTVQAGGITSLWRGLLPMVYRDVPGVAAWYTAFEGSATNLSASQRPL